MLASSSNPLAGREIMMGCSNERFRSAARRTDPAFAPLRDLERALAKLPTEQREVILLVGLEGMAYEEVADVLGVPVGTVRSRLSRGRDALRQLMGMPEKSHGSGVLHAA
jgi:RNA polymerase sigma factor (sigma-70 family)